MSEDSNKRNDTQSRARMSENQTKKGRCSSWLTEAANYGAEPIEPVKPVGKKSQIRSESSWVIKEAKKRNGSQFRPRMSENQTKKGKCSSWLTEVASHGAESVEPVLNRFSRLVKNPKFGQEIPKWLRKQTTTIMCGLYCPHPSNTIFISKGRKNDEEGEKAYEDEEDKL